MENIVCNKWMSFEDVHNRDFLHDNIKRYVCIFIISTNKIKRKYGLLDKYIVQITYKFTKYLLLSNCSLISIRAIKIIQTHFRVAVYTYHIGFTIKTILYRARKISSRSKRENIVSCTMRVI